MGEFRIWNETELHRLCEQHTSESSFLEFKSSPTIDKSDTDQIAKAVCGFANAGGGQVLFGVQEDEANNATALDDGWMPSERKKAWLGDVILAHVIPKVDFEIVPIPLTSGRELYVVNIRQGYTAHQAKDGKFFRRHETKCLPMDWFEIDDVKNRQVRPILDVKVEVIPNGVMVKPHVSASSTLPLAVYFSVVNKSPALVEYLQLHVWFHHYVHWDIEEETIAPWQSQGLEKLPRDWELYAAAYPESFTRWVLQRTPADKFFLMQSEHPMTLAPIIIQFRPFVPMLPMPWKIEVPNMKALTGMLLFRMNHNGILWAELLPNDADHEQILKEAAQLADRESQRR